MLNPTSDNNRWHVSVMHQRPQTIQAPTELSSRSDFKYTNATEKVISVIVTRMISIKGNRYLLVLYVQPLLRHEETHVTNQCLSGEPKEYL